MFESAKLRVRAAHLRWRVVGVPAGESVVGWYAGPMVIVDVHWTRSRAIPDGVSKPCRRIMSGGKLRCQCETDVCSVRQIGYVPLVTPEREHLVIIVSSTVAEMLQAFAWGTPIQFTRTKIPKTPLRLKQSADGRFNFQSNQLFRQSKPRDIRAYLLHLWQDEELEAFFASSDANAQFTCAKSTVPVESDVSARDNTPSPIPPLIRRRPRTVPAE